MKKNKILLLEDNPVHREVIFDGLEDAEYEIKKAENYESAKEILKNFVPDLFLLDIVIANEKNKGIQFALALSEDPKFKTIPVLFISAHLDEKNIAEHIPENFRDNVLPKPFDFDQLLNKIREIINK